MKYTHLALVYMFKILSTDSVCIQPIDHMAQNNKSTQCFVPASCQLPWRAHINQELCYFTSSKEPTVSHKLSYQTFTRA